MRFTTKTPRVGVTIAGKPLTMPAPFTEGGKVTAHEAATLSQNRRENMRNAGLHPEPGLHPEAATSDARPITAGEAIVLNRILRETVGNNLVARPALDQAAVDDYVASYEFGRGVR